MSVNATARSVIVERRGHGVSVLTLRGADAVLPPPEPGLPYLRHDRRGRAAAGRRDRSAAATAASRRSTTTRPPTSRSTPRGCTLVPGLVDCHTHLPFAGWRAEEYEMKVTGVPYAEIARQGGGIRSSARSLADGHATTRCWRRPRGWPPRCCRHGTTSLEGKSGYGLSIEQERRQLALGGAARGARCSSRCA